MSLEIAAAATSELTSASDAAGSGGAARRNGDTRHGRGAACYPPWSRTVAADLRRVDRRVPALTPRRHAANGRTPVRGLSRTAIAVFPNAKQAASAAVALQNVVAAHEWPHKRDVAVSVGVHSAEVGNGWLGPAKIRCQALCDAAEGGQIFFSPSAAVLLEEDDLGDLAIRDLGKQVTRRSGSPVRAFELVLPLPATRSPRQGRELLPARVCGNVP